MNIQRAKEIAESGELAKVTLNGVPVYIHHVNEDGDTVRIYPLNDPQNEQEVSVQQLREE